MPRINFVSFTFLLAFGLGTFAGIAMALLAVALARPPDETRIIEGSPVAVAPTATATQTATPEPTATPTPTPLPHTTSTLQVRIGPDENYAVLGTLASGNEVAVQGRDDTGDWVAIEFPPGSSARGWIPRTEIEGMSLTKVVGLEVLQASLIDTSPRAPSASSTPTLFEGNDGVPEPDDDDDTDDDGTPSVPRTPTATPRPVFVDLALRSVTVGPTGNVRVVVQNLGPGDVAGFNVRITAEDVGQETLRSGVLRAGDTTVFPITSMRLTEATAVTVEADPSGLLNDSDLSNNTWTLTLTP